MAAKSRPKKNAKSSPARAWGVAVSVLGGFTILTAAVINADALVDLWKKYFVRPSLAPLEGARNAPRDLIYSTEPVSLQLVQVAADSDSDERIYDLYMRNNTPDDLLLSEVRYGPGAVYLSAGASDVSGSTQPSAEYFVNAKSRRGKVALSPPFSLKAMAPGALRLRMRAQRVDETLAFEIYTADGKLVASVNMILGK